MAQKCRSIIWTATVFAALGSIPGCGGDSGDSSASDKLCGKVETCSLLGEWGYNNVAECTYRKEMIYSKYADCRVEFEALDLCKIELSCEKFEMDDGATYCPNENRRLDACMKAAGYKD